MAGGAGDIRAGSAYVEIGADESGFRAGLNAATARFEAFENNLKGKLGRRGPLASAFEIAIGGGAVAGVTMAAQIIGQAANKVAELNAEFNAGQLSGSQYAGEIARSIPVLGAMVTMFDELKGAITGAGAELSKLQEENKKFNDSQAAYEAAIKGANKALDSLRGRDIPPELAALDEAIKEQKKNAAAGVSGAGMRVKDLERKRAEVAGAVLQSDANKQMQDAENARKAMDAKRQQEEQQASKRREQENEQATRRGIEAAKEKARAEEEAAKKRAEAEQKAAELAKKQRRDGLESQLDAVRDGLATNQRVGAIQANPAFNVPATENPVVSQLRTLEDRLVQELKSLADN